MNKLIFSAPACLLLCACGLMPSSEPDNSKQQRASFDESREAILVFGLPNAKARVQLETGNVIDARYRADWSNIDPLFYGKADQGFVLVKVPADTPVAITSISIENRWTQFWSGGPFNTCKGQTVVVFLVPKGKVQYFSDFDFRPNGDGLRISATSNFSAAQSYVENNFPQWAGRLEAANFSSLTRADDCQKIQRPLPKPETAAR